MVLTMPKQNTHQNGASKLSEGKSLSADQSSANNNSANSVKTGARDLSPTVAKRLPFHRTVTDKILNYLGLDSSFLHKVESTKNGKRNVNSNSRQRATLKRERSSAEKSPQIRRKSAPYVKLSATVATQTPSRIRRQKSVNIPPPSKKSAKSPQIRRQYTVDNSSYHHNSRRRKSSTKCIEDLAVSVTEEEVIQAADAVRTIRFDDQELKSSQTIPSDQVSKTKSKDHSKKPSSSSHQYYHQGSSSSSGRKHHASPSAPAQKVKQMSQAVGGRHTGIGVVQGAASDIVRSGHLELDTLYASNESTAGRQAITVNVVNAPNNSTLQCGCENINCPFCNLMLSIEGTDPTVLQ